MFGIGAGELVLILIAGLIIFGPGELPKVGRAIGKGLREFKKAQSALSATLDEVSAEPAKKPVTADDVINLAKENPLNKETSANEKNLDNVVANVNASASNVTAGGNSNSTAK